MVWDGIQKRLSDSGKDSADVVLARVDENIKVIFQNAEQVRLALLEHQKEESTKFNAMNDKLSEVIVSTSTTKEILKGFKESIDALEVKVGSQNGRIGKVEAFKSWALGGVAILGVLFTAVVVAFAETVFKK